MIIFDSMLYIMVMIMTLVLFLRQTCSDQLKCIDIHMNVYQNNQNRKNNRIKSKRMLKLKKRILNLLLSLFRACVSHELVVVVDVRLNFGNIPIESKIINN